MDSQVIQCGSHTDARGSLQFCNGFDISAVKRFYTIANSAGRLVRGWIGYKRETKWLFPQKGAIVIVTKTVDDGNAEASRCGGMENLGCSVRFVLLAANPAVPRILGGNWFCIEQHNGAEVSVFPDCKVGEFANDDFRRPL